MTSVKIDAFFPVFSLLVDGFVHIRLLEKLFIAYFYS